jgi:AcrR family transcriptional regulator
MPASTDSDVRQRILATATDLFYRQGVRAVGIDEVIAKAAVAKASLYRHFRTKDELIAAFLEREDEEFWEQWGAVALPAFPDAERELAAILRWIGERIARPGYRGCPQLNVAAEFADPAHPARTVARQHKLRMRERLADLCVRLAVPQPDRLASQLALLIDGAFGSSAFQLPDDPAEVLRSAAWALVQQAKVA